MHEKIDIEKQNIAKKYFMTKFIAGKISSAVTFVIILYVMFGGVSTAFSALLGNFSSNNFLYRSFYFTGFYVTLFLISAPFSYYTSFVMEHAYGFSNQSRMDWATDLIKSFIVGGILTFIIVHVLYMTITISPDFWWFWCASFLTLFSVLLQHIAPILLIPIFYKLEALQDTALKEKLLQLADKAATRVIGIYTIKLSSKTKKANAALAGTGSTRRMLLGDTLLEGYNADEIETVMAHELAHHTRRHIPKLIIFSALNNYLGMYIIFCLFPILVDFLKMPPIRDIASLPLLVTVSGLLSSIAAPAGLYLSRKLEFEADDTAISLSGKPQAFISTMAKFANDYLSFAYPPAWLEILTYDHPPIGKRIERIGQNLPPESPGSSVRKNQ
jgi:STE24 endopeptidase